MSAIYTDVYTLKRNSPSIYNAHRGKEDVSNVIFISRDTMKADFCYKDNELICERCNIVSYYIHDNGSEKLCPKCLWVHGTPRLCKNCHLPVGCASCNGKSNSMIHFKNLLLCSQDKCLMPFGYCINDHTNCSCFTRKYKTMQENIPGHLFSQIKEFLPALCQKFPLNRVFGVKFLADLSVIQKNECLGCFSGTKYETVNFSQVQLCKGSEYICTCHEQEDIIDYYINNNI